MRFRRILVATLLTVALAAPGVCLAGMSGDLLSAGSKAPDFNFSDISTGTITKFYSIGRGKPVMLVFLQTACRSCFREMQTLKKIAAENKGIEVVGIFVDMRPHNFKKYVTENDLPFTFAWDANFEIAEKYGVAFTPTSFLIDRRKDVANVYKGFRPGQESMMAQEVKRILKRRR